MIFAAVEFRLVLTQKRLVNLSASGRNAEALADGALELALAHLDSEGNGPLRLELATGIADARISPGTTTEERRIDFSGVARSTEKVRAERAYTGTAYRGPDGTWKVRRIERKTVQAGVTGE
jgi:hypothetical protein